MNFLAHIALSGSHPDIRVGNVLGEFVKGRLDKYSAEEIIPAMMTGVRLHRRIDDFTDRHPVVRRSKRRLVDEYGLLSGVLIDMFYDHILAKEWGNLFPAEPLPVFAQTFYRELLARQGSLPEVMQPLIRSMTSRDWLTNYATLSGIEWSLKGIGHRFPPAAGIERSIQDLSAGYDDFAADFREFWPELSAHCHAFLVAEGATF
ncbi:MAG: DUF479 domain-containing protein [Siphonobacter aquaeclarae]|nr:DUF479 domain-containing protein [Siphonobacter aquaeclarae]